MALAKKKKRFFDVEIPLINRETQLIAYEIEELEGKYIKYDLTRILKGKSILLDCKVTVKDNKATAVPVEIRLVPYYIRRMMRKGTDYVEDSFIIKCKDSELKIKPILITRRKVSKAVRNALRLKAKQEIEEYSKSRSYDTLFEDVLRNKLQKELSIKLKKIYPLSLCEIRDLKVESSQTPLHTSTHSEKKEETIKEKIKEEKETAKTEKKKKTPKKEEEKDKEEENVDNSESD